MLDGLWEILNKGTVNGGLIVSGSYQTQHKYDVTCG
jgi:hypothetical protein